MKRQTITVSIILVCAVALAAYIRYGRASTHSEEAGTSNRQAPPPVNADRPNFQAQQQEPPPPRAPPPPPPPFPGDPPVSQSTPELPRSLIGMTAEDLKEFEKYLPQGAQIYSYAVGESNLAPAIITADLDGDGKAETIVVYNERKPTPEEGSLPLTLSVLAGEGNALRTLVSRQFAGGVLFRIRIDDAVTYLAARDLTGDGRPEIIVAPATGASVGGWLEVLSFAGSRLHELTRIGGHFFRVRSKGAGKPALITARWNGEEGTRSYQWNGQGFEETAKPVKESR
jgi:hypothetical protein